MTLPEGFLFSQSNLQDYVDCQRRFQLHYILNQAWPAVEAEPYIENEVRMDQGARFHKIARQYLVGVPESQIAQSIKNDEVIRAWWDNFLDSIKNGSLTSLSDRGIQKYEEISLSVPIGGFRIIAKYDLLVIHIDKRLTILDWKTSQRHPKRNWLAERLQTHVYPFVLTGAIPSLLGTKRIDPGQVEMVYWFTNQPDQSERFSYDQKSYQEDHRFLTNLIADIQKKSELIFPLTSQVKRCLFCTYRSLCNRGTEAGDLQHLEEWLETEPSAEIEIDFDQIGEIEF